MAAHRSSSRVGDALVKAGVLDELQLRSAMAQHDAWGGRLAHVVAEMGLAEEEHIVDTLARAMGVERIRLGTVQHDGAALRKLEAAYAEERAVFPVQLRDNGKVLALAMADPTDLATMDEVSRRARTRVVPYIAGEREIRSAIARHYRGQSYEAPAAPRSRAQQKPAPDQEPLEFKIVDMSGKTVMKHVSDIAPPRTADTSELLDQILTGAPPLTAEEQARLLAVKQNQHKSAKIVRAVAELLTEKGVFAPGELARRLKD
jgi:hypothetical protein